MAVAENMTQSTSVTLVTSFNDNVDKGNTRSLGQSSFTPIILFYAVNLQLYHKWKGIYLTWYMDYRKKETTLKEDTRNTRSNRANNPTGTV
jgi:hypothetical protein